MQKQHKMSSLNTTVVNQRKHVEQLRREATLGERTKVSVTCKDLIDYCQAHKQEDELVMSFANKRHRRKNRRRNPFDPPMLESICSFL